MAREHDPLMFEMKEDEVLVAKVDQHNLDLSLMEEAGTLCQASCLSDPQTTALSALQSRQLRLFSDAVNDDRFVVAHVYATADRRTEPVHVTGASADTADRGGRGASR